jgi:hypothetical protein
LNLALRQYLLYRLPLDHAGGVWWRFDASQALLETLFFHFTSIYDD